MNKEEEKKDFWHNLRAAFGRGVVIMIPVVITVWVLQTLFNAVDGIIAPFFIKVLHIDIPGLGFISMAIIILVVGGLTGNLIGKTIFKGLEKILTSIPLARSIYSAMKDLMGAFQIGSGGNSFRHVVMVEYPRAGMYTIGFMTNEHIVENNTGTETMASVYIPNPPNPTSGVMVLLPLADIKKIDMTVEEGLKLVLSGGIVTSGTISFKQ